MYLFDTLSSHGLKRFWRYRYQKEYKARVNMCKNDITIIKYINEYT